MLRCGNGNLAERRTCSSLTRPRAANAPQSCRNRKQAAVIWATELIYVAIATLMGWPPNSRAYLFSRRGFGTGHKSSIPLITHFLGDQEVKAYCRDLANRLVARGLEFPFVWAVLGDSGKKIADEVLDEIEALRPDLAGGVSFLVARYNRRHDSVEFSEPTNDIAWPIGPVLVLDSAVHSGRSMLRLMVTLHEMKAPSIISYGLVVKSGSVIVPTYFGLVIDDKDRAYFQLDVLPNNRLGKSPPNGVLREVSESDVHSKIETIGPPFTELTIGDLVYDKETKGSKIFIFEMKDKIAGFISFRKDGQTLFIDAWGTGKASQGTGVGSATMRWAETWARSKRCERIELWAYEPAIDGYKKYGYETTDDKFRDLGEGQRYKIMTKKILYNVKFSQKEDPAYY